MAEIDPANPYDLPKILERVSDKARVTVTNAVTYNNLLSSGYRDVGKPDTAEVTDVPEDKAEDKPVVDAAAAKAAAASKPKADTAKATGAVGV